MVHAPQLQFISLATRCAVTAMRTLRSKEQRHQVILPPAGAQSGSALSGVAASRPGGMKQ